MLYRTKYLALSLILLVSPGKSIPSNVLSKEQKVESVVDSVVEISTTNPGTFFETIAPALVYGFLFFGCIYTLSKMRNNDVLESSMSDLVGNIAPSVIPANNIAPQPLSEMAYQMGAQAEDYQLASFRE